MVIDQKEFFSEIEILLFSPNVSSVRGSRVQKYEIRPDFYYTEKHVWVKKMPNGSIRIGMTDYGQRQLGDVVFVEFPKVGQEIKRMERFMAIEIPGGMAEIKIPLSGKVREVNRRLLTEHDLINNSPYDDGWLITIEATNMDQEIKELLSSDDYGKLISKEQGISDT